MNVWPVAVNICICSRMLTDISSCFLRQSSMCLAMGRCATSVPGCALSDSDSSGGVVFGRRTVVIKVYCHGDAWHVSPYWLPFEPSKMECGTCLQSVPGVVQADQPYEQNNSHPFFFTSSSPLTPDKCSDKCSEPTLVRSQSSEWDMSNSRKSYPAEVSARVSG